MYFVTLGAIVGWIRFFRTTNGRRELDPLWIPFTLLSIVAALYVFGWFGVLKPGAYGVLGTGILLFLRDVWRRPENYFTPGLAFFLCSGVFIWLRYRHAEFYSWDEFVWGIVSKDIFFRHGLYVKESAIVFKDYPPGTNLAHYFFYFTDKFSEGLSFTAAFLVFAAGFSVLIDLAPRRLWILAAVTAAAFLVKIGLGEGLQTLMVDDMIGCVFGAALVLAFSVLKTPRDKMWLAPFFAVLPLLKTIGIVLVAILFAAIAVIGLVEGQPRKRLAGALLLLISVAAAFHWSWGHWKANIEAVQTVPYAKVKWQDIQRVFMGEGSAREQAVVAGWKTNLWGSEFAKWFRRLFWFMLAAIILMRKHGAETRKIGAIFLTLTLGWIFYLGVHFFVYLFMFPPYEAVRLISFERYQSQYVIAFYMVCLAVVLDLLAHHRKKPIALLFIALIAIVPLKSVPQTDFFSMDVKSSPERQQLQPLVRLAERRIPPGSHVWVIFQHSNGLEKMIMAYELAPSMVNFEIWSLGTPADAADVWTVGLTRPEWEKYLRAYDYVIVGRPNADFWARYGGLFDDQSKILYRVDKTAGNIQLIAVE